MKYFGGKFPLLPWLIDRFPKGNYHFIDLMCGSANVALNVRYPLITVNDINQDIINLFEMLRTREEELTRLIFFTPFSRRELEKIIENPSTNPLERAWQYFVLCQVGFGTSGSENKCYGVAFEYQLNKSKCNVDGWNLKIQKLALIAQKLRKFQIESRDAFDLFERVDSQGNIIYIDPIYLRSTRSSGHRYPCGEFPTQENEEKWNLELARKCKTAKAMVAVSHYDCPQYDEWYGFMRKTKAPKHHQTSGQREVQECLWTNYDPDYYKGCRLQF